MNKGFRIKNGFRTIVVFLTAALFVLFGITLYRVITDYNNYNKKDDDTVTLSSEEYTEKIKTLKKEIQKAEEELEASKDELSQFTAPEINGYVYGNFYEIDLFKEASKKYGMDYRLPYAIAIKESGFVSSAYAYNNNPGGIKNGSYLAVFESKKEGIEFMCEMIYKVYVVNGVDTPSLMQNLYCPGSDTWAPEVQNLIDNLEPDEE